MSNETKVGIFVVTAIGLFVATFIYVAQITISGGKKDYVTYLKQAGGLEAGSLVRFAGIKVGVVSDVAPDTEDPTRIEVQFQVKDETPVNEESIAQVSALTPLGGNHLELTPGSNAADLLPPGSVVQSEEAVTINDIMAKLAITADTANGLMDQLSGDLELIVDDAHAVMTNLDEMTGDANRKRIEDLLDESTALIAEQRPAFQELTTKLSATVDKVDLAIEDMRGIAKQAGETIDNVNQTVTETREPIKEDLEELRAALVEARAAITEVNALVTVNSPNIEETIENFRVTSANLEAMSDELRQRPWSLIRVKPKEQRQMPGSEAAQ